MTESLTVPDIRARKRSRGADPIVMITAYDTPFGADRGRRRGRHRICRRHRRRGGSRPGRHFACGSRTTSPTMSRPWPASRPRALLVADMPWLSYHLEPSDTVRNAAHLVRAGAQAVKLEGGQRRVCAIRAIIDAEIPVMGHLGLTPQSVHAMGGYKVQGREAGAASELRKDAAALAAASCFAIVLEGVPDALAERITADLDIPTIGIGAGPACDGQVIVMHDLLGLTEGEPARFVRRYAELGEIATDAIKRWAYDVRGGRYPSQAESYHASAELREVLGL